MCGVRCAGLIVHHLLAVTMVCTDEENAILLLYGFYCRSYTFIHLLNCCDGSRENARMSNHIRVCEVDDDHIIIIGTDRFVQLPAYFRSAHFRLQVIGCNCRGINQDTILVLVGLFQTAVEEEGYMCVLLGLRQTKLLQTKLSQILTEGIVDLLLLECHQLVRNGLIIILEAHIGKGKESLCPLQRLDALGIRCITGLCGDIRIGEAEGLGDLTGPVGTEVEEDHGIVLLHQRYRSSCFVNDNGGKNELIGHAVIIGVLHSLYRIGLLNAFAQYQRIICLLDTIPVIVTVHCIIPAGQGCNLSYADLCRLIHQLLQVILTGCRGCITSVEERMQIYTLEALTLAELKDGVQMCIVAVYTAVGKKSPEMQVGIVLLAVLDGCQKLFIFIELAVPDQLADQCQILINDPSGSDIHMSHLGISHLSVGKSYGHAGCEARDKGALSHQLVDIRGLCHVYGICFLVIGQSETIQDHKYYRFLHRMRSSICI